MRDDTPEDKYANLPPLANGISKSFGVLVVGDWLVDEHWVVGKHRAPSSSRTGREHSRALHRENCSVKSLCGAGQVATILYQAYRGGERPFYVNGIGIWHPADSPILQQMLDPGFNIGRTPHRLAYYESAAGAAVPSDNLRLNSLTSSVDVVAGTTRVIRIYRHQRQPFPFSSFTEADGLYARKLGEMLSFNRISRQNKIDAQQTAVCAAGHSANLSNNLVEILESHASAHPEVNATL